MKKLFVLFAGLLGLVGCIQGHAQCTAATINWDNLDYLISTGNYSGYVTAAMSETQRFAIGVNYATLTRSASITSAGENNTHTAVAGAEVQFNGNGTIQITFNEQVQNAAFTLFDIDNNQSVSVTAKNQSELPLNVAMTGGSVVTVTGSGTVLANAVDVGGATNSTNGSANGNVNVSIAGPVKTIVLSFSGTSGDFWLGNITACVNGGFITNYFQVSRPFTNQPAYVLGVHDLNTVFMINPANGAATSIFTDPSVREINNLAYDPYNRLIYYSADGVERQTPALNPATVKSVKRYYVNTGVIETVINDITAAPFNVPTFAAGLESGGAAFYDGALYLGVEGYDLAGMPNNGSTGRKSIIWRINFDASRNPISATQVYGVATDNGTSNTHDWADFVINNGVIYDFSSSGTNGRYTHIPMQSNATAATVIPNATANKPGQAAIDWTGRIYWMGTQIGQYMATAANTVINKQIITAVPGSVAWVASAGDAAEAFRPLMDFGDAPSAYDPDALAPAVHEVKSNIYIGSTVNVEWQKMPSVNDYVDASEDTFDDGLAYVTLLTTASTYLTQVTVFNNTGADATVAAWLDFNKNNSFEPGEGITQIVTSSASPQNVSLFWQNLATTLPEDARTYLRIRITSFANGMNVNNPTGYFSNGEVEDYLVTVNRSVLSVDLESFDAKADRNEQVQLSWSTSNETNFTGFEVQRSQNSNDWEGIAFINSGGSLKNGKRQYKLTDFQPFAGKSFYRLKMVHEQGSANYSSIKLINIKRGIAEISLYPNPAKEKAMLHVVSESAQRTELSITNLQGTSVYKSTLYFKAGSNQVALNGLNLLPPGLYFVHLQLNGKFYSQKLILSSN